MLTYQKNSNF